MLNIVESIFNTGKRLLEVKLQIINKNKIYDFIFSNQQYFVEKNMRLHSHYTMRMKSHIFTLLSFFCNLKSAF